MYKVIVFLLLVALVVTVVYAELLFQFSKTYPASVTVDDNLYTFTLLNPTTQAVALGIDL
ncbi:unnamed protein product, partial [marine sediment metagenome]